MSERSEDKREELDAEELDEQHGEALPDREVMSAITLDPGPMPLEPPE